MYMYMYTQTSNLNLHWIPKLSASVKYSLARPDHCLVIFPTCWLPSADRIYRVEGPEGGGTGGRRDRREEGPEGGGTRGRRDQRVEGPEGGRDQRVEGPEGGRDERDERTGRRA